MRQCAERVVRKPSSRLTLIDGTMATTDVIVNQHVNAPSTMSTLLTVTTEDGSSVTLTPDHALFVDGKLAAASDVKVGLSLTSAQGEPVRVNAIHWATGAVINPVTGAGTILAAEGDGLPLLAASHPIWIAPTLHKWSLARGAANVALKLVGDGIEYDTAARFASLLLAKLAALVVAIMFSKAAFCVLLGVIFNTQSLRIQQGRRVRRDDSVGQRLSTMR